MVSRTCECLGWQYAVSLLVLAVQKRPQCRFCVILAITALPGLFLGFACALPPFISVL